MNATEVCARLRERKESRKLNAVVSAPQRKPPWETSNCNVWRNARVDKVLEDLECVGCKGYGAERVEGSGVTITLDDWDNQAGLPRRWDNSALEDDVEEREKQVTPPREVDFES